MISLHKSELGTALTRLTVTQDIHEIADILGHFRTLPFKHQRLLTLNHWQSVNRRRAQLNADPFFHALTSRQQADKCHALISAHAHRYVAATH